MSTLRADLRKKMRDSRNKLSQSEQQAAELNVTKLILQSELLTKKEHIALYLNADGELSTQTLLRALWQQNKSVYLPLMHPFAKGYLIFQRFDVNTPLHTNRFGILEPVLNVSTLCPVAKLDAIFTPLVAFDPQGSRLGMGGGFYDRTLSQLPAEHISTGTATLIGLAHSLQCVPKLPTEAWDKPLHFVATPEKIWQF